VVEEILGVDIGGVIMDGANDRSDTSFFSDNYLRTTATADSFEVLGELVAQRFGDRVYLVSVAGPNTQRKTREWFAHHRFHEMTGVRPDHINFCRRRFDKVDICRALGITHFIDDRLEILGFLHPLVQNLFLFAPDTREVERFAHHLPHVHEVPTWQALKKEITPR